MRTISQLILVFAVAVLVTVASPVAISQAAQDSVDQRQIFLSWLERAQKGNANTQVLVGVAYQLGLYGVSKNDAEAVKWYRLAAAQGEADAQYNLGVMYAKGEGVPKNDAEAARWYRRAADQGNAYAQTDLGLMYAIGEGVPKNEAEAYFWWNLAAAQGDGIAKKMRESVAPLMSREQIADAQRRSAAWKPKKE